MKRMRLYAQHDALIGTAIKRSLGWFFLPNVSGHRSSRKNYDTAFECIPAWARRQSVRTEEEYS